MTEITLNESDRQILAECAEQLGVSCEDALHEAVSCLHASLTEALPRTSTDDATRFTKSRAAGHFASGKQVQAINDARSVETENLWGAARAGIRAGLQDARYLPGNYFAPVIAFAYWIHDVTERAMTRWRS
jgi:hypothetical protein